MRIKEPKVLPKMPFGYLPNRVEYAKYTSGYYIKLTAQTLANDEHKGPMTFTLDCCMPKAALNRIIDLLQEMVDTTAGNIVKTADYKPMTAFARKAKELGLPVGDNRTQEVKSHENQG